jgi:arginyl-tRNA synthetase
VLTAETDALRASRLALSEATLAQLSKSLGLLGIGIPERM